MQPCPACDTSNCVSGRPSAFPTYNKVYNNTVLCKSCKDITYRFTFIKSVFSFDIILARFGSLFQYARPRECTSLPFTICYPIRKEHHKIDRSHIQSQNVERPLQRVHEETSRWYSALGNGGLKNVRLLKIKVRTFRKIPFSS